MRYINLDFFKTLLLQEIRDILLQQVAKREILAVLIDNEKKRMESVEEMMKDVIKYFKDESTKLTNFRAAMKSLSDKKSETESQLIPAEDTVMIKVHNILFNHQLVSHIPTYPAVFSALDQLDSQRLKLEKQILAKKAGKVEDFKQSSQKLSQIFSLLEMSESGARSISLTPGDIKSGTRMIQIANSDIKEELRKISDDWEKDMKELRLKPELEILRDAWINFIVKPNDLVANLKNLEHKVNR